MIKHKFKILLIFTIFISLVFSLLLLFYTQSYVSVYMFTTAQQDRYDKVMNTLEELNIEPRHTKVDIFIGTTSEYIPVVILSIRRIDLPLLAIRYSDYDLHNIIREELIRLEGNHDQ